MIDNHKFMHREIQNYQISLMRDIIAEQKNIDYFVFFNDLFSH